VYETRRDLARLFGIRDASRLVFTHNATEALNLAIKGALHMGDHVVTSSMEHNAVWRCLRVLEAEGLISVTPVRCAPDGSLDVQDIVSALRPNTRLMVFTHASNVTGTLMPIGELGQIARERGVILLVDAAQTAGVYPVDVEGLSVDLLAFTGHKGLLGPQGTGGLYIREGINLRPLKEGGTGSESTLEHQPFTLPDRYEAGTLNVPGIAGLGAAVRFILDEGLERIREREVLLTGEVLEGLSQIPAIRVYGPQDARRQVGVVSIGVQGVRPGEVAYVLDEVYSINVRAGLHCSPCAHRTIGTLDQGTLRISLGYFNSREHVEDLVGALGEIAAG